MTLSSTDKEKLENEYWSVTCKAKIKIKLLGLKLKLETEYLPASYQLDLIIIALPLRASKLSLLE